MLVQVILSSDGKPLDLPETTRWLSGLATGGFYFVPADTFYLQETGKSDQLAMVVNRLIKPALPQPVHTADIILLYNISTNEKGPKESKPGPKHASS